MLCPDMSMRLVGIFALGLVLAPRTGEACSCPSCPPARLVPSGEVPANVPRFRLVHPAWGQGQPIEVTVVDLVEQRPIRIGLLLPNESGSESYFTIREPLVPGRTYQVRIAQPCGGIEREDVIDLFVGPERPLPHALGHLVPSPLTADQISLSAGAQCAALVSAHYVDLTLAFDPSAEPWATSFDLSTIVDDEPWAPRTSLCQLLEPGTSWLGRGVDRIFTTCGHDPPWVVPGLEPGRHTVQMRATLSHPDERIVLETPLLEVELGCEVPEAPPEPPPEPPPESPPQSASSGELATDEPHCGCTAASWAPGSGSNWLLLLAVSALVRASRRGRR